MAETTWDFVLKAQQEDFLERLRQCCDPYNESLRSCLTIAGNYFNNDYNPFEILCIDFHDEYEAEIDNFCFEMTWKFGANIEENPAFFWDQFINQKIGKIGEEAVKFYLGSLVNSVDYQIYENGFGDGGIDFTLAKNAKIAIQVKTTTALRIPCWQFDRDPSLIPYIPDDIETLIDAIQSTKWKVDSKGISKNALTIFVLVLNEIIGDDIERSPYRCLISGFLPSKNLKPNFEYKIHDFFYSGGIRAYLKYLTLNK